MAQKNFSAKQSNSQWMAALAFVYIQQQQYDNAIVLLEAQQVLFPDDPQPLKALALAYLRAGRNQQALDSADQYLSQTAPSPALVPLFHIRARALWGLGKASQARHTLQQSLALKSIPEQNLP